MSVPVLNASMGVGGKFRFIRRREDLSIIEETPLSNNMVLNAGLDWLFDDSRFTSTWTNSGVQVGSGNTPPDPDDAGLETYVAGTTTTVSTSSSMDIPNRVQKITTVFRFTTGAAAGNLSEVGIGIGANNNTSPTSAAKNGQPLFSRALIVDEFGNPTTITVLSNEILDVVWEYYKYAPIADITGSFDQDIDGSTVSFDYVARPATTTTGSSWGITSSGQVIPSRGAGGSMGNSGSGASTTGIGSAYTTLISAGSTQIFCSSFVPISPYVTGNYYLDARMFFDLSTANFNILGLKFNFTICGWMMEIDPTVNKIDTKEYYIDVRLSIARYP